ncbi:MAG: ABC transporter ATP-binding protein [Nocardioidaceae bacterium]
MTTTTATRPATAVGLGADDLTLGYGGRAVVDGLDLDVAPGEVLVVVGTSGCGKSTLLRAFAGLLRPMGGRVTADRATIDGPSAERALVFQDDALLPWRSVLSNVELPLAVRGLRRAERRRVAVEWLERVGLADHQRVLPRQLSGGMRQRAQLARALAGAPGAILMDEPFGALDAQSRTAMQRLLVETLRASTSTVVFVTHDVDEALVLGDRIVVLGAEGVTTRRDVPRPRELGSPPDMETRHAVLEALGAVDPLERRRAVA